MAWVFLALAAVLIIVVIHGLVTGTMMAKFGLEFPRDSSPVWFWALTVFYLAAAGWLIRWAVFDFTHGP